MATLNTISEIEGARFDFVSTVKRRTKELYQA
jgi:hypothetical protein